MKRLLPLLKIISALTALILEFLPKGIKLISKWPVSGTNEWHESATYHSYVDPMVYFGAANWLAPITVILTIAILVITIVALVKETRKPDTIVFVLSIISVITSLPILYGLYSYTLIGFFITVLLVLLSIVSFSDIEKRP